MKRFKEANILYQRQDYQNALVAYEEVVAANPEMTVAYFYLGNSYDNLFKPGLRGEPENDALPRTRGGELQDRRGAGRGSGQAEAGDAVPRGRRTVLTSSTTRTRLSPCCNR